MAKRTQQVCQHLVEHQRPQVHQQGGDEAVVGRRVAVAVAGEGVVARPLVDHRSPAAHAHHLQVDAVPDSLNSEFSVWDAKLTKTVVELAARDEHELPGQLGQAELERSRPQPRAGHEKMHISAKNGVMGRKFAMDLA